MPVLVPPGSTLRFSKVDRCWQLIASKEALFSCSHRRRFRSGSWLVNPDFAGRSRWFGSASYEALRVTLVSNIEYILALP